MTLWTRIKSCFTAFKRGEDGSASVELLMITPVMVWVMLSTLTYFDAYHHESINNRAGMTIADAISRETEYITEDYIDGMYQLLQFLVMEDDTPDLRMTAYYYDEGDDKYVLIWSKSRGGYNPIEAAEMDDFRDRLPIMSDQERAVLVETQVDFKQFWRSYMGMGDKFTFSAGINHEVFDTFNVISPRFVTQICYNNTPEDTSTAIC